jgi:chromatin remodeling complex protein RSC6
MPAQKKTKRTRKAVKPAPEPVVEEETKVPDVSEVLEETPVDTPVVEEKEVSVPPPSSRRMASTREELEVAFDTLLERLSREVDTKKEDKTHALNLKTLRSLVSDVKKLKRSSLKLARKKERKSICSSEPYGFEKPVKISSGMCKFAGWDPSELHSRVDVTKFICNYIAQKNLQNPSDRRQIIPDKKLSKLLGYDAEKEEEPLTYFRIQQRIKNHFV